MSNTIYKDFDIFTRALIGSRDVDPIYNFIKAYLSEHPKWQKEWFCFAYVNMYSLESAMKFCNEIPDAASWLDYGAEKFIEMRESKFISKMGIERRGSQRAIPNQYLMFETAANSLLENKLNTEDQFSFKKSVNKNVHMYGPWATFKIAEVYEKALGYKELSILDLGINERDPNSNDGPMGGLRHLYGRDIQFDKTIIPTWNRFGENLAKGYGVDIGEIESSLCKFHKLVTGKYYIGHDIDELHELSEIVGKGFGNIMLGEFNIGFTIPKYGVEREYKGTYKESGKIINANYCKLLPELSVLDILLETN